MLPGGWVGTENKGAIMMNRPLDAGSWSKQLPLPLSPHIPTQLPLGPPCCGYTYKKLLRALGQLQMCFSMNDHF